MITDGKLQAEFPENFVFLFKPYRYKIGWGGRAGMRSWSFARALLLKGRAEPLLILCTREVQKSIRGSVHKLLNDQSKRTLFSARAEGPERRAFGNRLKIYA